MINTTESKGFSTQTIPTPQITVSEYRRVTAESTSMVGRLKPREATKQIGAMIGIPELGAQKDPSMWDNCL